jgi:hypothetical protein
MDALEIDADSDAVDGILAGDLWQRHAKSPAMAYDRDTRDRELAELSTTHHAAVASALDFARRLIDDGRDATFAAPRALSGLPL